MRYQDGPNVRQRYARTERPIITVGRKVDKQFPIDEDLAACVHLPGCSCRRADGAVAKEGGDALGRARSEESELHGACPPP